MTVFRGLESKGLNQSDLIFIFEVTVTFLNVSILENVLSPKLFNFLGR